MPRHGGQKGRAFPRLEHSGQVAVEVLGDARLRGLVERDGLVPSPREDHSPLPGAGPLFSGKRRKPTLGVVGKPALDGAPGYDHHATVPQVLHGDRGINRRAPFGRSGRVAGGLGDDAVLELALDRAGVVELQGELDGALQLVEAGLKVGWETVDLDQIRQAGKPASSHVLTHHELRTTPGTSLARFNRKRGLFHSARRHAREGGNLRKPD